MQRVILGSGLVLATGCSGLLPSITPIDAELNIGDKTEKNQTAVVQSNQTNQAETIETDIFNYGMSTTELTLVLFITCFFVPSFKEMRNMYRKQRSKFIRKEEAL